MDRLAAGLRSIAEAVLEGKIRDEPDLEKAKKRLSSRLSLASLPSNADILSQARAGERVALKMLIRKPTRTLSGVAVIAAMTSPAPCPHGTCVPCPGGVLNLSPQSYTGREPAALRACQHHFDPYEQVRARLAQLDEIGHPLDKSELIIMGGTITSRPLGYQNWFVKRCLQAMNDFPGERNGSGWQPFEAVARANENSLVRNIGTTFETRPDWCRPDQIKEMLRLGATKVELGVQSLDEDILVSMRRGHTVEDTAWASANLREVGLKVGFHMMPGLPGSSPDQDFAVFRRLFSDPRFRPDYLKIYPTLVIEGTELFRQYQRGEYIPLGDHDAAELVCRIKEILPRYVRLQRVQRDIPSPLIVAGAKKSNLRQLARQRLEERGKRCQCIRCREAGLRGVVRAEPRLRQESYTASGGNEHFLSFETEDDILMGFLRLRLSASARVRELHVYGPMVPIGGRTDGWQHRGYGSRLLEEAERLALDKGYPKIEVTSGIGVRGYYRRLGYDLCPPHMTKRLA